MRLITQSLIFGNIAVLIIYLVSLFIEKISGFGLLIWNLRQIKNHGMARGAANIAGIMYFIVNFVVLQIVLDLDTSGNIQDYSFYKWFIFALPLTVGFRFIHLKLTPIDNSRDDFDFQE